MTEPSNKLVLMMTNFVWYHQNLDACWKKMIIGIKFYLSLSFSTNLLVIKHRNSWSQIPSWQLPLDSSIVLLISFWRLSLNLVCIIFMNSCGTTDSPFWYWYSWEDYLYGIQDPYCWGDSYHCRHRFDLSLDFAHMNMLPCP